MTNEEILAGIVLGQALIFGTSITLQSRFYMRQIQTLLDKVKASSFESYTRAVNPTPRTTVLPEPAEDLRAMDEFSTL